MGYECKCGKLVVFNVLFCCGNVVVFMCIVGDMVVLVGVCYVIMLDVDMQFLCDVVCVFVVMLVYLFNCLCFDLML